jgi:hypothetical protein
MAIHSASHELASNVQINFPSAKCCNCGSVSGIFAVSTNLKVTKFLGLGGTEITIKPQLPFCANCKKTARRIAVGIGSKVLVSLILFFLFMISLAFVPSSISDKVPTEIALMLLFAISFSLVLGLYSLRKPTGSQTSYYQPIRLKKVKQKFSGEIVGYVLAFTNKEYQKDFIESNREAVNKKVIETIGA